MAKNRCHHQEETGDPILNLVIVVILFAVIYIFLEVNKIGTMVRAISKQTVPAEVKAPESKKD